MTPVNFPQSNAHFSPPPDLEESQCHTIHAWQGVVERGSCEGSRLVVTAWQPTQAERAAIAAGHPVFFSCLGGLPPHFLTVDFKQATNPA